MRGDGESPATNFPAPVTRLIGRDAAVARLRDLISAYRVVTLTGPGGIGKSALALAVVRHAIEEFRDGGWLVELASLSDAALVPSAVASVLGLKISGTISADTVARADRRAASSAGARQLRARHRCGGRPRRRHSCGMPAHHDPGDEPRNPADRGEYVYRVPPLDVPALGRG